MEESNLTFQFILKTFKQTNVALKKGKQHINVTPPIHLNEAIFTKIKTSIFAMLEYVKNLGNKYNTY